jgi:hypothetical protein
MKAIFFAEPEEAARGRKSTTMACLGAVSVVFALCVEKGAIHEPSLTNRISSS